MSAACAYRPEEFPHGLRCAECDHLFTPGEKYAKRLVGMTVFVGEPAHVVELVCVPCALRDAVAP